jgi:hypothetical protein
VRLTATTSRKLRHVGAERGFGMERLGLWSVYGLTRVDSLAGTAKAYEMTLVTADERLLHTG